MPWDSRLSFKFRCDDTSRVGSFAAPCRHSHTEKPCLRPTIVNSYTITRSHGHVVTPWTTFGNGREAAWPSIPRPFRAASDTTFCGRIAHLSLLVLAVHAGFAIPPGKAGDRSP